MEGRGLAGRVETGGTADILGIDRRTLFRKIKQFDLEDEEGK